MLTNDSDYIDFQNSSSFPDEKDDNSSSDKENPFIQKTSASFFSSGAPLFPSMQQAPLQADKLQWKLFSIISSEINVFPILNIEWK